MQIAINDTIGNLYKYCKPRSTDSCQMPFNVMGDLAIPLDLFTDNPSRWKSEVNILEVVDGVNCWLEIVGPDEIAICAKDKDAILGAISKLSRDQCYTQKLVFKKSSEQVELIKAMWSKDEKVSLNARRAFACLIEPTIAKLFPKADVISKSESIAKFTTELSSKEVQPEEALKMVEDTIYADQLAHTEQRLSETPRTDAATITIDHPDCYGDLQYVTPEFAGEMEREINILKNELESYKNYYE